MSSIQDNAYGFKIINPARRGDVTADITAYPGRQGLAGAFARAKTKD
jgi:hypothetical protein